MAKNMIITRGILHELGIISEDFAFRLLINNIGAIVISEGEKVIHYHHIRNLIEKKTIEVSHIPTSGMATDGLTKALMFNKFKEFVELVGISKIEASDGEGSSGSDSSEDSKPATARTAAIVTVIKTTRFLRIQLTKRSKLIKMLLGTTTKKKQNNCMVLHSKRGLISEAFS